MNAETMTINPNELVIDMPVDDDHVKELMTSLQKNGRMVEPVSVWLQGMRIINGFHRTEAAKRLGWDSMPCLIQDLTEDAFWDARIIAAKPHQRIESDRLTIWMAESWKLTKWCKGNEYESLLAQAWELIKKGRLGYVATKQECSEDEREIVDWFKDKAARWGIPAYEIADKLKGIPSRLMDNRRIAEMYDLSLEKAKIALTAPDRRYQDEVHEWVKTEVAAKDNPTPFYEWFDDAEEQKRKRNQEQQQKEYERQQAYLATEAGKAQAEKVRIEENRRNTKRHLEEAKFQVVLTGRYFDGVSEAPVMLAEFAQFVVDFAAEHFPDVQIAKPNPVALENSRLRSENARLKERISSLERALNSKQSAGEMLSGAIAWSSADIESA